MTDNDISFGQYIRNRRESMEISLRKAAGILGMTPTYLSDVERGMRYAPEKYLEALKELLEVKPEEQDEFYDLAGKSRLDGYPDLKDYLDDNDIVRKALRKARDMNITDSQWMRFMEGMNKDDAGKKVPSSR